MKISDIKIQDVADYLRLEIGEYKESELSAMLAASKKYISAATGIPETGDGETLDDHEDFYIAVMVLCQDAYDNRTLYINNSGNRSVAVNRVVDNILGMHCRNPI